MKLEYEEAKIEVILLNDTDVIAESGGWTDDQDLPDDEPDNPPGWIDDQDFPDNDDIVTAAVTGTDVSTELVQETGDPDASGWTPET